MLPRSIRHFLLIASALGMGLLQPLPAVTTAAEEKPPVMAVFTLSGTVTEAPAGEEFLFSAQSESFQGLLARLKQVEKDENARGVVLLVSDTSLGRAQIEEVRAVLKRIQAAGKQVVAHADSLSMRTYLLVSCADRISVVPTGDVWINGIYGESPYLRGLFDKLGIRPDYETCGDYKSAAETFMRHGPSPQAQENLNWLMDDIFESCLELLAEGRQVDVATAREWIDEAVYTAERARELGIIDSVQFRQELEEELRQKYGQTLTFDRRYGKKRGAEIDLSSPLGILKFYGDLLSGPKKKTSSAAGIAIVYVDGMIVPGSSDPSGFPLMSLGAAYSTPIAEALRTAAEDDTIKAVVLRVDSPGGSAVASEIILNATKRVAEKKPFVVSMGNVAGSGGYYVSCGAPTVFADRTTITGSIGVVGGKFATTDLWQKVGVAWSPVQRGANADMLASDDVFSEDQREKFKHWMEEIYAVFKQHVLASRQDRLKKPIDELAGGRVYTGQQARELGLVDELGGLEDAIAHVAKQAGLEDYELRVLPRPKSFLEVLMSDLQNGDDHDPKRLSSLVTRMSMRRTLLDLVWPQLQGLEPQRTRAVLRAVWQAQLMQQERVVTAMPVVELRD